MVLVTHTPSSTSAPPKAQNQDVKTTFTLIQLYNLDYVDTKTTGTVAHMYAMGLCYSFRACGLR